MSSLTIRVWDVGHGLASWIITPAGHNHWIDVGFSADPHFSPSAHVAENYPDHSSVDLLTISHPDKDHFDDLSTHLELLGKPRVLLRNKTLPDDEKFGSQELDYQKAFLELDAAYTSSIAWEESPLNSGFNGGVETAHGSLDWNEVDNINNSSVVVFYLFRGTLVVFPGDIEDSGWQALFQKRKAEFSELVAKASTVILVAPHHGRASGYSENMFSDLGPHLSIVSDKYGKAETDNRFRTQPLGLNFSDGEKKFLSTKTNGRILIRIDDRGGLSIDNN